MENNTDNHSKFEKNISENDALFFQNIKKLKNGDFSLFLNETFLQKFPHYLFQLFTDGKEIEFGTYNILLLQFLLNNDVKIREKTLRVIAVVNTIAIKSQNVVVLNLIAANLMVWLEKETEYLVGYAVICKQLEIIGPILLDNGHRDKVENLINLINEIEAGNLPKNAIITQMVVKVREEISQSTGSNKVENIQKNDGIKLDKIQKISEKYNDSVKDFSSLIRRFLEGSEAPLQQKSFTEKLPHFFFDLHTNNLMDEADSILGRLEELILGEKVNTREKGLMVIAVINNLSLASVNLDLLQKLFEILLLWLEKETVYIVGYAVICKQLQQIGLELVRNDYWSEAESLLEIIYNIENDIVKKNLIIKNMMASLREYIASQDVLEKLIRISSDNSIEKPSIVNNFVKYFGRSASLYLLEKVVSSNEEEDCVKIMNLLPGSGEVVPVLQDCLDNDPPWYVIKNVICIISQLGDPKHYIIIEPFLEHPDLRVQQRVINCITKLGGTDMIQRMKHALSTVDDELKGRLIMHLEKYQSEDISDFLLDLLFKKKDKTDLSSEKIQLIICVALRSFPYPGVINFLKHYAKLRKQKKGGHDRILWTVDETIKILEPRVRHIRSSEDENVASVSFESDPVEETGINKIVQKILDSANRFVQEGNREEAAEYLFKKSVESAMEKDFLTAEILSEKIINVNPNALPKMIRAGEIIEEEKSSSITASHLEVWDNLYEDMITEEFNAFYFAMKNARFNAGETIIVTGETDPSLYFINSGTVRMTCKCGDDETFLKRLHPGDVAGVGQFFSSSVWTVTLTAQNLTRIQILEKDKWFGLINEYPGIESKLKDFCVFYDTVPELVRMSGNDRREFARYEVSMMVSSTFYDAYGQKGKRTVRGEMIDISRGGLAFYIRISKKENVKHLLGKHIVSEIQLDKNEKIQCHGTIVGARNNELIEEDVSIHVKLYRKIENAQVERVIAQIPPKNL
ncbi:MAG: cyclic nucleotide-binding domain-containing protein [Desulfobacteraceae bacterium]|nr:cyclic nucleotide-binding domain-containing protein [Desulfobacteraceae bacterium]